MTFLYMKVQKTDIFFFKRENVSEMFNILSAVNRYHIMMFEEEKKYLFYQYMTF